MSFLSVGGELIPVAPGGAKRDRLDPMDRARAFDLTYRAALTGNPKRDFLFSTPPVSRQAADLYEYVLTLPSLLCSGDIIGGGPNLLTFPDDFDNAAWSKSLATVTPNVTAIAVGFPRTVDQILETATTGSHGVFRTISGLTDNTSQVTSVFAFSTTRGWMIVQSFDKAAVTRQSWINLSTGALGTVNAGHTIKVDAIPGGFFQVSVTWNSGTGGTTPQIAFFASTADTVANYLGDITKGIYLGGARHSEQAVSCCPEITGWTPVKQGSGYLVVLDFVLHEN